MKQLDGKDSLYIFTGGLGSGKTEIAVNYCITLRDEKKSPVYLIDLDIVKPYYRSRHLKKQLVNDNIVLVAPPDPYLYADLPLVPPEINALLRHPSGTVVVDVGGDDAGARVLGCFSEILKSRSYHFLYVINTKRPFAEKPGEIMRMIEDIQQVSGLQVTGIINNTHLLWETTPDLVRQGAKVSRDIAKKLGVPLMFHGVNRHLKRLGNLTMKEPVFELNLYFYPENLDIHDADRETIDVGR